jgi:chemotaxis methyl-accepting protein methylase
MILPELIERRSAERTLHSWVGAGSSGHEPYSMAML